MKKIFHTLFFLFLLGCQLGYAQKKHLSKSTSQATASLKPAAGTQRVNPVFYRDSSRFSIALMELNTRQSELSATFFKHGLFFAAAKSRQEIYLHKLELRRKPRISIYYIPHPDSLEQQQEVQLALENARQHNFGMPFFVTDQEKVLFTLSKHAPGEKVSFPLFQKNTSHRVSIYEAKVNNNIWFNLKELFPGDHTYSIAHPTLSADGNVLYFASDMPGGYGGSDIYVSYRENDDWTAPVNLGGIVNSKGNEVYPFIHEDGNLYYASDREGGMGGFDVYEAVKGSEGFSRISNMGAPVNSAYDDIGLVLNQPKRMGYFSSNRPGGYGEFDIYRLDVKLLNISRNLTDGGANVFSTMNIEITGQVLDSITNQPVKRALVKIRDFNNDDIKVAFADNKGKYKFVITNDNKFQIAASKIGYNTTTDYQFSTYGITSDSPLSIDILMSPVTYTLTLNVSVFETSTSLEAAAIPIPGATLQLKDLATEKTIEKKSDARGNYRFILEQNKTYALTVLKEGYQKSLVHKISTMNKTNAEMIELNMSLARLEEGHPDQLLIKAIVRDRLTKKPLTDAVVLLRNLQTKEMSKKTTDQDGVAVFEADTAHNYTLESIKEKYQLDNYVQVSPRGMQSGVVMEALLAMKPITYEPVPLDFAIAPIYYPPGKTTFDNEIMKQLDEIYQLLNKYKSLKIAIVGHTDNTGSKEGNLVLSQKRATAAMNYLLQKGLPRTRIADVRGVGDASPIIKCEVEDCTDEEHRKNRRTEIVIVER